mgnify:CR=1 FL=1
MSVQKNRLLSICAAVTVYFPSTFGPIASIHLGGVKLLDLAGFAKEEKPNKPSYSFSTTDALQYNKRAHGAFGFLLKIKFNPPTNAGVKTVKNIKNSIGIKYTLLEKNFCGHVSYIHC